MSHRVYLYNVHSPSEAADNDIMMMEWGYEMPLLLQPLLIDQGYISGNNYNNHTEDNAGLFYNAQPGIKNLKQFYDFLEQQDGLIHNREAFETAKRQMFEYLDKLQQPYFHLDAWDVFNMSDVPHTEQAKEMLAHIAHNNRLITSAIENNDISLLQYSNLMDVTPAFKTFGELLNYEGYQFGWASIWQSVEEEDPSEVFEEGGLYGLKDNAGNILLPASFEEFYEFSYNGMAVVKKDNKYGYVNRSGDIVVPLIWDDAYDFEYSDAGIVQLNGQWGLIDETGNTIVPPSFEDIKSLGHAGEYFNAQKNGKWGILDKQGNTRTDFIYDEVLEEGSDYYHTKNETGHPLILNRNFVCIGSFPVSAVNPLLSGLLLIKPYKGSQQSFLFGLDGAVLTSGFDKINNQTSFSNLVIIRKGKKYGAAGTSQHTMLLPYEYDALIDMEVFVDGGGQDIVLVQKDGLKGVFDGKADHASWLFPLDSFENITWLGELVFAVQKNGKWAIALNPALPLTDYEYDLVVRRQNGTGFAYAFKGDEVYTVQEQGIVSTDKQEALTEASSPYYHYYFDENVRRRLLLYASETADAEVLYETGADAKDAGDLPTAILLLTLAAEKGSPAAMNNLAHTYYTSADEADGSKAFYWYEKGAAAGNVDAMNGLGMCYYSGTGTETDAVKAIHWLERAVEKGSVLACNNLGDAYFENTVLPQDLDKSLHYFLLAEKKGSPVYDWIAYLYDLKENYPAALKYYTLSYEEGNAVSAFNLGIFYRSGLGTPVDVALGITYFNTAVERGHLDAHRELADIYSKEPGFIDKEKARYHTMQADANSL